MIYQPDSNSFAIFLYMIKFSAIIVNELQVQELVENRQYFHLYFARRVDIKIVS